MYKFTVWGKKFGKILIKDENFWEYFVPKANSPFKPINEKICYVIEIQSGSNLEGEGFFGLEDKKNKTVLAFHVDDIIQLNLNSKIEKIFDLVDVILPKRNSK